MLKQIVFISGATSGIGAAFARHYAKEGYDLILTGHPDDKILPSIKELKQKYNVNVEIILADLADDKALANLEKIIRNNKRL